MDTSQHSRQNNAWIDIPARVKSGEEAIKRHDDFRIRSRFVESTCLMRSYSRCFPETSCLLTATSSKPHQKGSTILVELFCGHGRISSSESTLLTWRTAEIMSANLWPILGKIGTTYLGPELIAKAAHEETENRESWMYKQPEGAASCW